MAEKKSTEAYSRLLGDRKFRWLASGGVVSSLGDQFTIIALPWLVLKLTGDPLALGTVVVAANVPRTFFILLGGALADRYSIKHVLTWTQCLNAILLGSLAFLVLAGVPRMWMIYALALGTGLMTAFSLPSWPALLARTLAPDQLGRANSVLFSAGQIAAFCGPLLAGALIALFGDGGADATGSMKGIGAAFLLDAASFLLSACALSRLELNIKPVEKVDRPHVLKTLAEGMRCFWKDRDLRTFSLYAVTIVFFIIGPMQTAMPVLARQLGHSSAAFGTLAGIFGAGGVAGTLLFGLKPNFRIRNIGTTMLVIDFTAGMFLSLMAYAHSIWQAGLILFAVGILGGFVQVMAISWMQQRESPAMLGRIMSVFMFLMQVVPLVSAVISGWLMRSIPANLLYSGAGVLLVVTVLIASLESSMQTLRDSVPPAEAEF